MFFSLKRYQIFQMPGRNKIWVSAGASLLTVLFLCTLFCEEVAALDVNADIAADTEWTVADSPVVINKADFTVPVGVTLTIQPGVTVKVKSYIYVYGVLSAVGTSDSRISFVKHDGDSNWAGIYFKYTVGVLNENEIKYADLSDTGGINGSINSDRQSVVIDNCTVIVSGNYSKAIYGWGGIVKPDGLAMSLTNSTVTLTSTYDGGWSGKVKAVYLDGFDATVSGNTITVTSSAENLYVTGIWLTVTNTEIFTADILNNNITVTGTHNSITNIYGTYFEEWEASGEIKGNTMNLTGPRSVIGVSTYSAKEISGNNITSTITSNYATATGYGIYSQCTSAGSDDYVFDNTVHLTTTQENIPLYCIYAQCGKIRNNVLKTSHSGSSGKAFGIYTSYYDIYIENNSILMTTAAGVKEYGIYFGTHNNASKTSYLKNNIVQGSAATDSNGIYKGIGYTASVVNNYNAVYDFADTYDGLTAGTGSLTSDPDFADASLHLNLGSSAIDAGDWASAYSNEPAPNGGRINMGAYGNTASATVSPAVPTVTTTAVSSITTNSAASGGNVTSIGAASITARGVCWSTSANPTTSDSKTTDSTGTGSFTSSITGLNPGITYYVRAYATNSAGTTYGSDESFTTSTTTPTITTTAISSITSNSSSSGGNVTSDGGASVTARGVCWSTSANPTTSDSKTTDSTGTGSFTSSITGLNPGITYYVRAYATNSAGTTYGSDESFTTSTTTPTITTTAISSITSNSSSSGGNVTSDGGASVTARGVCWSTSANPTTSDSKTTDSTGIGSFTSNITGLNACTTYYVRAYATNSAGTSYGDHASFKTSYTYTSYVSSNGRCGDKSPCYESIQMAINATETCSAILIVEGTYDGPFTLNQPKSLILQGGWDSAFENQTGTTTLRNVPKTTQGSLTLQELKIQPE